MAVQAALMEAGAVLFVENSRNFLSPTNYRWSPIRIGLDATNQSFSAIKNIFQYLLAQPIGCIYICNHMVSFKNDSQ